MAELPRGTVSLMFTDIEGSTQLQRRLGDEYQRIVESHRVLLEEAIAAHGGTVVDRQTESFFAVFSRARDAVRAAVQAQRAIADHVWPEGGEPKVRMGIHAGEPELLWLTDADIAHAPDNLRSLVARAQARGLTSTVVFPVGNLAP